MANYVFRGDMMSINKYISFFDEYRLNHNKDNEYKENYNHIKKDYSKQLGIEVNKKYREIEYEKINENIKYEKIKVEGLIEKNKANQLAIMGAVIPIAVVILAADVGAASQFGLTLFLIIIGMMLVLMFVQFGLSKIKAKENHVYNTILKVLYQLALEINEEQLKTKKETDDKDGQKLIEQLINIKGLVDEVAPAFSEMAAGIVSKVFRKNK